MNWKEKNNIKSFSENVLLTYFEDNSNTMTPFAKIMHFCRICKYVIVVEYFFRNFVKNIVHTLLE
jgi:hypothetical protein